MSELAFNRVILQKYSQTVSIVATVSLSLNLILAILLIATMTKPPLIVYSDDGVVSVLKTTSFKAEETQLRDFIKMVSASFLNFTPSSLPKQIEEISPFLGKNPKETILESYEENQGLIQKNGITQQFSIISLNIIKKSDPFWVEVCGVRTIFGKEASKATPITYIFEIKKTKPQASNPYGLVLTDIVEKKSRKG